ncbi:MAG: hypothetical protein ACOC5J_03215 [Gemmatimonadota bacterium]
MALGACEAEIAPPFEVEGTGWVEGHLFLDTEGNGRFDPGAGDEALPGVDVEARERGTTRTFGSPVTTDAEGRFTVQGLPPGTHDVFVIESTVPEGVVVCQNPVPTSVYRDEPTGLSIGAREACLISIAEARELGVGEFVNIRGIVTSHPGQVRSSYVYLQDATGGIQFFTSALNDAGLEIGDLIDVSGTLGEFNSTLQLESVQLNDVEPGVGAPAPTELTTAEIMSDGPNVGGPLQGLLAVVRGAELQSPFDSGGSRNATIDDGSGGAVLRVESGVVSGNGDAILDALGLQVGACYDIVGMVGAFGSEGQLFPRSGDDFTEVSCEE